MKNTEIANELKSAELSRQETNIEALLKTLDPVEQDGDNLEEQLSARIAQQREVSDIALSAGAPQEAKRYLDQQARHLEQARKYERQANTLEREIRRGNEPEKRMSEVKELRNKAKRENEEANRCKRKAEAILTR